MMQIDIGMSTDDNFAVPAAVTISSLATHLGPDVHATVHVIGYDLQSQHVSLLTGLARRHPRLTVRLIERDPDEFADLPISSSGHNRITRATYGRLVLPEVVPQSVERLLYLDADILVRRDVAELYAVDPGENVLAARHDPVVPEFDHPGGVQAWQTLELSGKTAYFNAGVLVIELKRWRAEGWGARIRDYLVKHSDNIMLFDQEALNAVVRGRFTRIDGRWNAIEYRRAGDITTLPDRMEDAYIVHFLGDTKPWDEAAADHPGAGHAEYWEYAERLARAE
jgi:lipopolysaccharide biosynthesis glycosyltransferase